MQWDRFGKGLNTQLEKLEIQTMMGQLNNEHDFLIKKLSELIEAIKWLLLLMKVFILLLSATLTTANDDFWESTNTNKDGYLDPDEFRSLEGFSNSFISGVFGKYDADEDGLISLDEYKIALSDASNMNDIYEYSLHWIIWFKWLKYVS